jgi:hypothetical protein
MPEALTKKMFGLPRWAWLLILAVAIGIGLYLRMQRNKSEEEEIPSEESPTGLVGSEAVPVGGYNEYGEGGGYYEGGPSLGGSLYKPPEPEAPPPGDTVINIGQPPLPGANDDTGGSGATPDTVGVSGNPCSKKPTHIPPGYKAECVSGRWRLAAKSAAKKPAVSTGGGPPDRKDNKRPKPKDHTPSGGVKVHPAAPLPPAPSNPQHPAAVDTGNPCVKGGVGGHTAPPGYHLFCQGGRIWRAPNS